MQDPEALRNSSQPHASVELSRREVEDMAPYDPAAQFDTAFAMAQAEFPLIPKNRTVHVRMRPEKGGGSYVYEYAELSEILKHCRPCLNRHGITFRQRIVIEEGRHWLETVLAHEGYREADRVPIFQPSSNHPQDYAGAVTYAKRLGASAMLGISAEDDNDGNATGTDFQAEPKAAKAPEKPVERTKRETRADSRAETASAKADVLAAATAYTGRATKLAQGPARELTEAELERLEGRVADAVTELREAADEGRGTGIAQIWGEIASDEFVSRRVWNELKSNYPDQYAVVEKVLRPEKGAPRGQDKDGARA